MIRDYIQCDVCQKEITVNIRGLETWVDGTTRFYKVVYDITLPNKIGAYHCHPECLLHQIGALEEGKP